MRIHGIPETSKVIGPTINVHPNIRYVLHLAADIHNNKSCVLKAVESPRDHILLLDAIAAHTDKHSLQTAVEQIVNLQNSRCWTVTIRR